MTEPPRTLQERPPLKDTRPWVLEIHRLKAALDAQSQLLAEAREALEPFAKYAGKWTTMPDDLTITQGATLAKRPQLTMGDCNNARAVHAKLKATSGKG